MFDDEHGSLVLHVGSEGKVHSWTSFCPHCATHAETVWLFDVLCMQHASPAAQSALETHASDAI